MKPLSYTLKYVLMHVVKMTLIVTSSFSARPLMVKYSNLSNRIEISYQEYSKVPNFRSSGHFVF